MVLTLLIPTWLALWFFHQSSLLSPAMLAPLCSAGSTSSAPDLASKTLALIFVRSDPYNFSNLYDEKSEIFEEFKGILPQRDIKHHTELLDP